MKSGLVNKGLGMEFLFVKNKIVQHELFATLQLLQFKIKVVLKVFV